VASIIDIFYELICIFSSSLSSISFWEGSLLKMVPMLVEHAKRRLI
jgi:hypothetical protein